MNNDTIVVTSEDLTVHPDTPSLFHHDEQVRPTAQGRVTAHALTTNADGEPLGIAYAGTGHWEIGDIIR